MYKNTKLIPFFTIMSQKPRDAVYRDGLFHCTIQEGEFTATGKGPDPRAAIQKAEAELLQKIREAFVTPDGEESK